MRPRGRGRPIGPDGPSRGAARNTTIRYGPGADPTCDWPWSDLLGCMVGFPAPAPFARLKAEVEVDAAVEGAAALGGAPSLFEIHLHGFSSFGLNEVSR